MKANIILIWETLRVRYARNFMCMYVLMCQRFKKVGGKS